MASSLGPSPGVWWSLGSISSLTAIDFNNREPLSEGSSTKCPHGKTRWLPATHSSFVLTSKTRSLDRKRSDRNQGSQNNKIIWLSNRADTFIEKFTRCAKVYGCFSLLCVSGADWLGRKTLTTWISKNMNHRHLELAVTNSRWSRYSWTAKVWWNTKHQTNYWKGKTN